MAFAAFGPGILILTRTDLTTPLAINVGYAQEFSLDAAGTTKMLYGQNQYPLVAARSTIKATGKFKSAEISGIAWNACFFGNNFSTGGAAWSVDSTYSIPGSTNPTVQVGSTATFESDLGVTYSTKGLPMQRVSTANVSALTVGQYAATATGLYYFADADESVGIKVTYRSTTATGETLNVINKPIGYTPTFQLDYYTSLNQPTAKPFVVRVYQCIADKLSMPFKLEDFMIPEFDFSFFADSSNRVFDMTYPEIS